MIPNKVSIMFWLKQEVTQSAFEIALLEVLNGHVDSLDKLRNMVTMIQGNNKHGVE